ncbi:DUF302 domain-containing protein [Algivirga pacifica]|uniref:DUF302 domain-containing protein n=1 Tax=Algivirga pacifica TaxID=1162670 RepID=A0ABP9D6H4_9BACT
MKYYQETIIRNTSFSDAIEKVTEALKTEGFGVLTTIDMQATMKKKLEKDIPPYTILGACNPSFAFEALQEENKIGTMLPCNVIVQEVDGGIEVAAVDPAASMMSIENPKLEHIAGEVREKLKRVIAQL